MENFKSIIGFSKYEISDLGNVRSKAWGKLKPIKQQIHKRGYNIVRIANDEGKKKMLYVHRLVAQAFITNPKKLETVNHKNEIKTDNRKQNLEWMSRGDNYRYSHTKQVARIYNGKIEKVYDAIKDVELDGFGKENVSSVCRGVRKTANGYVWKFV